MASHITRRTVGTFVIETGIPVPKGVSGRRQTGLRDLLRAMQVGDSALLPGVKQRNAWVAADSLGMKVKCRTTEEGLRIWRIE